MKRKTKAIADWFFYSILIITALNFSFFTFTATGEYYVNEKLKVFAYLRPPLAVFGILYMLSVSGDALGRLFRHYLLVALLFISVLLSMISPHNYRDALIYGMWLIAQVMFLVLYIDYLIQNLGRAAAKIKLLIPLALFSAYFLVLALLRIQEFRLGQPFPAFFTFYVIPAMIAPFYLGAIAGLLPDLKRSVFLKWAALFLAVFAIVLIAVSGKRASMLTALIVFGGYALLMTRQSAKGAFAMVLLLLLGLPFGLNELSKSAYEATEFSRSRIERTFTEENSSSISDRKQIWSHALDLSLEHPLGVGLNNGNKMVGGGLHNTYVGYMLELGWLSFLLFILIVMVVLLRGVFTPVRENREFLFFIFLPAFLYNITEYNTAPGQLLFLPFWISMIFIMAPVAVRKPVLSTTAGFKNMNPRIARMNADLNLKNQTK